MTTPSAPLWDDFMVMSTSARWLGESEPETAWATDCQLFDGKEGTRVVVFGRLRVVEARHEMSTSVGISSVYLSDAEIERLHDPRARQDLALAVNELVHDRAFSVAMTSASLVGIALPRRWAAPEPDYEDSEVRR